MKLFSYRAVFLFVCAIGMTALVGCASKTDTAQGAGKPATNAAASSANVSAAQSGPVPETGTITRADINPHMSKQQQDRILRQKNGN